jgi:hypothetical protein
MKTLTTLRAVALPLIATVGIATTSVLACGGGQGSGSSSSASCSDVSCADAGSGVDSNDGGYTPPPPPDAACIPSGDADLPDDDFNDSNCDGIDGDRARAIFVAPAGSDSASGAVELPVKTIAKAIALATAAHKDVYVCTSTYAEAITIAQGVGIYGGYDCQHGWQRSNDRATIAPSKGIPLSVRDAAATVTIDRLALKAADAYDASASSIAALVARSPSVAFNHASLEAGRGADGTMPDPPHARAAAATAGGDGQPAQLDCDVNATLQPAECERYGAAGFRSGDFTHEGLGGPGGRGGNRQLTPQDLHPGLSGGPSGVGGIGGGDGRDGLSGLPGTDGASGKSANAGVGAFTADGYVASNVGSDGVAGSPGGGGGGGAGGASSCTPTSDCSLTSRYCVGGGGGQGGYGGAGGDPAKGSGAGGASIALLAFDSAVSLVRTQIGTATGGRGGASVPGAVGQLGGAPGKGGADPNRVCGAHSGGAGAHGGGGGAGGAGGGGPAIGIFSNAAAPKTEGVTFNVGAGGKGGTGLSNDGADGVTAEIMATSAVDGGASDAGHSSDASGD